jgi:hypothetical protein
MGWFSTTPKTKLEVIADQLERIMNELDSYSGGIVEDTNGKECYLAVVKELEQWRLLLKDCENKRY